MESNIPVATGNVANNTLDFRSVKEVENPDREGSCTVVNYAYAKRLNARFN